VTSSLYALRTDITNQFEELGMTSHGVEVATSQSIITLLEQIEAKKAEIAAAKELKEKQEYQKVLSVINSGSIEKLEQFRLEYNGQYLKLESDGMNIYGSQIYFESQFKGLDVLLKIALDKIEAKKAEKIAKEEEEKEEKAAKELAPLENIRAWIMQNGSALLKKRIEHSFNYVELYKEEWVKTTFPELELYSNICKKDYSEYSKKNPTLHQIEEMETLSKLPFVESAGIDGIKDEEDYKLGVALWVKVKVPNADYIYIGKWSK
jgi:hypothetical protein